MERIRGQENQERFPSTVSVSLLLTHGRAGRLLMVKQGLKDGESKSWGPIAGGVDQGENAWDAALREAWEEARIPPEHIIFVRGRDSLEPHVALIRGDDKNSLGLVFSVTYSGPRVPLDGWDIDGDKSVDRTRFFTWQEVLNLMDSSSEIYRPDFNFPQLLRWTLANSWRSQKRARVINQWLSEREEAIPGLCKRKGSGETLLAGWHYTPPYNQWMEVPGIHGDPNKTNFARARFYSKENQ
ncbi:NUDIX hydrolase [Patescibacteria group bacterium]